MQIIVKKRFNERIDGAFDYKFLADKEGLYIIEISARARGEKQIGNDATNDDDLRIEIDGRKFPKLDNPQRYLDAPAAFSGGRLHNLKKTVFFFIQLSKGKHTVSFVPDGSPFSEEITIEFAGGNPSTIDLNINQRAEDGDRRPWITFVLVDLPLAKVQSVIKAEQRFLDSDDVKIIIDDETKRNLRNGLRKFWFWLGSMLKGRKQTDTFTVNLKRGLHYLEFWADRTPTLQSISFNFGEIVKRIPNLYDPEWAGDPTFKDDSEQMILARAIFGEARDERLSDRTRIVVGWSIRNRVEGSRRATSYYEVILQPKQYSAFNEEDKNRPYVEDPLHAGSPLDKKAWFACYEIAGQVIRKELEDPTDGANHYYDQSMATPYWATKENFKIKIDTIFFHRL
ncbi:MAG: cell wall hydrolase [Candidatus Portnoybacteria bacterium]|nr:cell wall hydrolase [Candidatus Portnoybacteria bacterium]